ncbi:squamosa promoter binding protein-like 7 [Euphorbia peplus]|nr:squamosa promoter binding protein-like 7 [Euphorbia peplus]
MEPPPPISAAAGAKRPKFPDMESEFHPPITDDPSWDWGDLLDFSVDDHFPINFDPIETLISHPTLPTTTTATTAEVNPTESTEATEKSRKRDPRLTCSNFLAGMVPCACPELDAKLEEEEALRGKKRVRTVRANSGIARCQVPGCGADISELKGYHKRHKVCLRCANSGAVEIDGENKRYCQQCGKFHLLSDFDEGKRSCRRKLERHNDRRRRKPHDSKVENDKELTGELQNEDTRTDGEASKDCEIVEKEAFVESEDGNVSTLQSAPNSQNPNSDSGLSVGTQNDGGKDDSKLSVSPSNFDNKSFYSSMCPTGRISFKLYDWNPAEFPRRLRHQIFQWLASMPVELEGYIRPGCTILTAFLAMPTFMWEKLLEDPESYVHDFVIVPGKMLSKRGPMLVYLNDMVFYVLKDGNAVEEVNREGRAPRLHYVHPTFFEAGKPIEFVVCGTNLLQPKFRLLVSFSGKYLAYDYCVALPHGQAEGCSNLDHQLCKISIPHIKPSVFGPAFIEVENENGLSNFIPILIGDRKICSEMKIIQQRFDESHVSKGSVCEVSSKRQMAFSDFISDVAWLLRKPSPENIQLITNSHQIQRLNFLLDFLVKHESSAILGEVLLNLKIMFDKRGMSSLGSGIVDTEMRILLQYVDSAKDFQCQRVKESDYSAFEWQCSVQDTDSGRCSDTDTPTVSPCTSEDLEKSSPGRSEVRSDKVPLLNRQVLKNTKHIQEKPNRSCSIAFSNRVLKYRPVVLLIATVVCLGVCATIIHPDHVSKIAATVRRCLNSTTGL